MNNIDSENSKYFAPIKHPEIQCANSIIDNKDNTDNKLMII